MLVTDHHPNPFLKSVSTLSRRQTRWVEYLERFTYTWQYRPGRVNVADPLSRAPLFLAAITRLKGTFMDKVQAESPKDLAFADESFVEKHGLQVKDGLWRHGDQYVVPTALVQECLHDHHDTPMYGHGGVRKTEVAIMRKFWWPTIHADVAEYVQACDACQKNKSTNQKPIGLLQPLQTPEESWESISMDLITQLPVSKSGHDAIVVFVDRLSKMVHFAPTITEVTAEGIAKLIMRNVVRLHGVPREIVSDRDTRFTAKFMRKLCELLGIKQSMSTAFHPQSDGQTERANRVLEDMLRHYVSPAQDDWDEHLSMAEFAVNNGYSE